MTAQSHPYVVTTYPTQSAAMLAASRVAFNTGLACEVRSAMEVRGVDRLPVWVLATVTEAGAQVAAETLERFA